jgi:inosose dehydratase
MKIQFRLPLSIAWFVAAVGLLLGAQNAFAYDENDLETLLSTNQCNQCDLSNADLSNKDLYGSSLMEANLTGADLSGALLREANLTGGILTNATLTDAKLNGATLTRANMTNAILTNANLTNTKVDAAIFDKADLSHADLSAAILSCTSASDSSTCASLVDARAQSAIFNNAILSGADLTRADLTRAAMRSVNFESATLQDGLFCDTDLTRAIMPDRTLYNGNIEQYGGNASCNSAISLSQAPASYSCVDGTPIFPNPQNIQLGITPTVWSNSDDLSIDLNPPIPYQQIMSEIALSGFKGTQMAPKFPKDMNDLRHELSLRDITISEPWVGTFFTIGATDESQKTFDDQLAFMQSIGGNIIVVAEMGGAVHQQPIAPIPNRPHFTDAQWQLLLDGLNDIGQQATAAGMKLVYHHHIGTGVESMDDIDRLMEGTDPDNLYLLLDTGHAYYAGIEPLALLEKYQDRIAHVHLKNIRQSVLDESIDQGMSFLDSVRAGVFTVPGDAQGALDFDAILTKLANANYQGWLIVEAEQDPNKANPLEYARIARQYLCEYAGL